MCIDLMPDFYGGANPDWGIASSNNTEEFLSFTPNVLSWILKITSEIELGKSRCKTYNLHTVMATVTWSSYYLALLIVRPE